MTIRFSMVTVTRILLALLAAGAAWGAWMLSDLPGGRAWVPAVEKWGPIGMTGSAILLAFGAIFWPWLVRGKLSGPPEEPSRLPARPWEAIALLALLAIILWANFPRMHHPLWGDEEKTMRNYVVGQYKPTGEDEVKWRACVIGDTLWDYQSPNNHGFYSLVARWTHGGRRTGDGPLDLSFAEWKLRLPAMVASALGVVLLWLMMRRWGFGAGAGVAVLVMAAHPWFTRYSTEARGYGLLFLLWPLALFSAVEAMRTGKWRWWLALGVVQALLFWTWMLQLHWLLALNLALVLQMALAKDDPDWLRPRRWLVAGALAALIVLPLQLPAAIQLMEWMEGGKAKMPRDAVFAWLADVASTALSGEPWRSPDSGNPLCPARSAQWAENPFRIAGIYVLPVLLVLAGLWHWTKDTKRRWLPAMVLPFVIVFAQGLAKESVLLPWYAAPALPALAMVVGAGAENLTRRFGRWQAPAAFALAAGFLLPGQEMSGLLRRHPMEQTLEATLLTRSCLNPDHPDFGKDSITVQPQLSRQGYDPLCRKADSPEELKEVMRDAARRKLPLFVHLGDPRLMEARSPEMALLLENPDYFTKLGEFPGMDGPQRRVVWKWTGREP